MKSNVLLTGAVLLNCILYSCTDENEIGNLNSAVHDTTFVRDTLYDSLIITRTVNDTVYKDTLTTLDTVFAAADSSASLFFGIVYDLGGYGTTEEPVDTSYVSLTVFDDIRRTDITASVNGTSVKTVPGQSIGFAMQGFQENSMFFSMLGSVVYESLVASAAQYQYTIIIPVYPSDTTESLRHDTISDAVSVPASNDTFSISSANGPYNPVNNPNLSGRSFYIDNSKDVVMKWHATADFYMVSVYKILLNMVDGTYSVIGESLDTLTTDSVFTVPSDFIWIESATPVSERYNVVKADVIPFNGPTPAEWDTLPSFESRGLLMGVNTEYAYELLVPTLPDTANLGKINSRLAKHSATLVLNKFDRKDRVKNIQTKIQKILQGRTGR